MVNTPEFQSRGLRSFPGRGEYDLLFDDDDIVNLLLKSNGGETEGFILLFLLFGVL